MPSVAADSSFLNALFDATDRAHQPARDLLASQQSLLITNIAVVTEVAYLLDYSPDAR